MKDLEIEQGYIDSLLADDQPDHSFYNLILRPMNEEELFQRVVEDLKGKTFPDGSFKLPRVSLVYVVAHEGVFKRLYKKLPKDLRDNVVEFFPRNQLN